MMHYKSKAVPVKAVQFWKDGDSDKVERLSLNNGWSGYALTSDFGDTTVDVGDWIVEFPNGEVHVVKDIHFKQRFEHVEMFTPEEVKNAISMARLTKDLGDCA